MPGCSPLSAAARAAGLVFASLASALSAAPLPAPTVATLDQIVRDEMASAKVPAVQLAVAVQGELVYERAFGFADLEQQVPATTQTRFRTASVAKSFTAAAALRLVEEGKLALDGPIQTACPAFPVKEAPITLRMLLAHTSGVRHYQRPRESSGAAPFFTLTDSLALFKDDPLLFLPGSRFGYSTYAYSVIGCAIEGATGLPFEEALGRLVLEPAGLRSTTADQHFALVPQRARPYALLSPQEHAALPKAAQLSARPGEVYNAPLHDTSMKRAGGGLLSTASDLARFALAFAAGKIVEAETRDSAWKVQALADGAPVTSPWGPVGLGWFVRQRGERRELYASGGQVGARASVYLFPDDGLVLSVMTNLTNAEIDPMLERMLGVLLPAAEPHP